MKECKPIWIIEDWVFNDGTSDTLVELCKKNNTEVFLIDLNFRTDTKLKSLSDDSCVFSYGSLNLASWLLKNKKWIPNIWLNGENLICTSYYSYWSKYLLQQEYTFYTLGCLKYNKDIVYKLFGTYNLKAKDYEIFIRPNSHLKTFSGQVIRKDNFDKWFKENIEYQGLNTETLVVIGKTQEITNEWRFIISDRKVITFSQYYPEQNRDKDLEVEKLVNKVIKDDWQPDNLYTLDICKTIKDEYKVLEIGSVNTSALYGCDLNKFFKEMTEQSKKEWMEINE